MSIFEDSSLSALSLLLSTSHFDLIYRLVQCSFAFLHLSGHSGLGKSTLVNTLFKSQVSRKSAGWARDEKIPKTVEIKAVSHGECSDRAAVLSLELNIYRSIDLTERTSYL